MKTLSSKIKELEEERHIELSQPYLIFGLLKAEVISAQSMADLNRLAYQQGLEIPTLPLLAQARIASGGRTREFLWRYYWLSSSALSRVQHKGRDYGIFTHINPFRNEEDRIDAYKKSLGKDAVQLTDNDISYLLSMEDGKDVIIVPFKNIISSSRGMISLKDVINKNGHVIAMGALRNDRELLDMYIESYIDMMQKSRFTPTEIGIWFSEGAKPNTMRPLAIGDSGIGIYNWNLTNRNYRAVALKK